jgi:hypothetical protein
MALDIAIGQTEEGDGRLLPAKASESFSRLSPTYVTQAHPLSYARAWMGSLAISDAHHFDQHAFAQGQLYQATGAEDLVVWMWREDHEAPCVQRGKSRHIYLGHPAIPILHRRALVLFVDD